jgi:biopolymer transport protein TolR
MALAKRNEGAKISSDINVTPMVDVMLVLLIIFMVVTPMLQKGVSVDMAQVNNPLPMQDADKEDALLVSITRDGTVYFGTEKITTDNLTTKVKDRLTNRPDKRVYVKADMRPADRTEEISSKRPAGSSGARAIRENDHGNGSWPERRPKRKHERHTAH